MSFRESFTAGLALIAATIAVALPAASQARGQTDIAAITIEPAAGLQFRDSEINNYSLPLSVGIRSAGIASLEISSIRFTGPDASDFALDVPMPCPASMLATSSCSFPVYFAPKSLGPKLASLEVESNALEGTTSIPLTGNGTPETVEPVPPPRAYFTKKPRSAIKIRAAKLKSLKLKFGSDQSGATFECSLNKKPFSRCGSPLVLRKLKPGKYTVKVKASHEGRAGRPSVAKFKVVRARE